MKNNISIFLGTLFLLVSTYTFSAEDVQFKKITCRDSSKYYVGGFTYDYPMGRETPMVKAIRDAEFKWGMKFYENRCHQRKRDESKYAREMGFQFLEDCSNTVVMQTSRIVTYVEYCYEYSGGAHANYGSRYTTYLKPYGQNFSLQGNDFSRLDVLKKIITNALCDDCISDTSRIFNELEETNNIEFKKDSVVFHLLASNPQPPEGMVVPIPYDDFIPLLKPEAAKVMEEIRDSFHEQLEAVRNDEGILLN